MDNHQSSAPEPNNPVSPRKAVERALILPLIGLLLLIPPIATIFEIESRFFGIPFTVIYLFVIWAILIFSAFRLSRQLQNFEDPAEDPEIVQTEERDKKP